MMRSKAKLLESLVEDFLQRTAMKAPALKKAVVSELAPIQEIFKICQINPFEDEISIKAYVQEHSNPSYEQILFAEDNLTSQLGRPVSVEVIEGSDETSVDLTDTVLLFERKA